MRIFPFKKVSRCCETIFMSKKHSEGAPIYGTPYSTYLHHDKNGDPDQLRIYGGDGTVICDYDFNDHNKPKYHPFSEYNGAHKHKWMYDHNGHLIHGRPERITKEEFDEYIKPYLNL